MPELYLEYLMHNGVKGLITREGVKFYRKCFYIFCFFYDALLIDTIEFWIERILFFRDRWTQCPFWLSAKSPQNWEFQVVPKWFDFYGP